MYKRQTLTGTSDFSEIDPTLVQGDEVTLDGEKALTYVRSRHHIDDQTNIARMARQRQFLAALEETLRGILPAGMVPSVEVLPRMPLTPNGKCDYAALKELP